MLVAAVEPPAGLARLGARQVHAAVRAAHELSRGLGALAQLGRAVPGARSARRTSQTATTTSSDEHEEATHRAIIYLDATIRAGMVGVRGFEPPTPASRTQYSTRLSYTPNRA